MELTAAKQEKKSSPAKPTDGVHSVHGQVSLHDGQPAANAHVAVIAMRAQARAGGDLSPPGEVLAEGTTDERGNFRLTLTGVNSKTHRYASVIARKDGLAVAWQQLNLDEVDTEVSLELRPEEPIRGKLVDIEGQGAAGVTLTVQSVMGRSEDDNPSREGVGYRGAGSLPAAWIQPIASDKEGRFTVVGVPVGHGVFLTVEGSDRFAPQDIALNTGMPEQRGERDATYRSLVKNVAAGACSPKQLCAPDFWKSRTC